MSPLLLILLITTIFSVSLDTYLDNAEKDLDIFRKSIEKYYSDNIKDVRIVECPFENACGTTFNDKFVKNFSTLVNLNEISTYFQPGTALDLPPHEQTLTQKSINRLKLMTCGAETTKSEWINYYENNPTTRWQYFGDHRYGSFSKYPGTEVSCPRSYDPRFRPWYASAASGPKNVIILVENSKEIGEFLYPNELFTAVSNTLKTFNFQDYVQIVKFSDDATYESSTLLQATEENIQRLQNYASQQWGNSNLKSSFSGAAHIDKGLTAGFEIFQNSFKSGDFANCFRNVMILITTGKNAGSSSGAKIINNYNSDDIEARIFAYVVGNIYEFPKIKEVTCLTNGVLTILNSDQGKYMSQIPYFYEAFASTSADNPPITWSAPYTDFSGLGQVITRSQPVFDRTDDVPEGFSGNFEELPPRFIGVVAADIRVEDVLSETNSSYKQLYRSLYKRGSSQCFEQPSTAILEYVRGPQSSCAAPLGTVAIVLICISSGLFLAGLGQYYHKQGYERRKKIENIIAIVLLGPIALAFAAPSLPLWPLIYFYSTKKTSDLSDLSTRIVDFFLTLGMLGLICGSITGFYYLLFYLEASLGTIIGLMITFSILITAGSTIFGLSFHESIPERRVENFFSIFLFIIFLPFYVFAFIFLRLLIPWRRSGVNDLSYKNTLEEDFVYNPLLFSFTVTPVCLFYFLSDWIILIPSLLIICIFGPNLLVELKAELTSNSNYLEITFNYFIKTFTQLFILIFYSPIYLCYRILNYITLLMGRKENISLLDLFTMIGLGIAKFFLFLFLFPFHLISIVDLGHSITNKNIGFRDQFLIRMTLFYTSLPFALCFLPKTANFLKLTWKGDINEQKECYLSILNIFLQGLLFLGSLVLGFFSGILFFCILVLSFLFIYRWGLWIRCFQSSKKIPAKFLYISKRMGLDILILFQIILVFTCPLMYYFAAKYYYNSRVPAVARSSKQGEGNEDDVELEEKSTSTTNSQESLPPIQNPKYLDSLFPMIPLAWVKSILYPILGSIILVLAIIVGICGFALGCCFYLPFLAFSMIVRPKPTMECIKSKKYHYIYVEFLNSVSFLLFWPLCWMTLLIKPFPKYDDVKWFQIIYPKPFITLVRLVYLGFLAILFFSLFILECVTIFPFYFPKLVATESISQNSFRLSKLFLLGISCYFLVIPACILIIPFLLQRGNKHELAQWKLKNPNQTASYLLKIVTGGSKALFQFVFSIFVLGIPLLFIFVFSIWRFPWVLTGKGSGSSISARRVEETSRRSNVESFNSLYSRVRQCTLLIWYDYLSLFRFLLLICSLYGIQFLLRENIEKTHIPLQWTHEWTRKAFSDFVQATLSGIQDFFIIIFAGTITLLLFLLTPPFLSVSWIFSQCIRFTRYQAYEKCHFSVPYFQGGENFVSWYAQPSFELLEAISNNPIAWPTGNDAYDSFPQKLLKFVKQLFIRLMLDIANCMAFIPFLLDLITFSITYCSEIIATFNYSDSMLFHSFALPFYLAFHIVALFLPLILAKLGRSDTVEKEDGTNANFAEDIFLGATIEWLYWVLWVLFIYIGGHIPLVVNRVENNNCPLFQPHMVYFINLSDIYQRFPALLNPVFFLYSVIWLGWPIVLLLILDPLNLLWIIPLELIFLFFYVQVVFNGKEYKFKS